MKPGCSIPPILKRHRIPMVSSGRKAKRITMSSRGFVDNLRTASEPALRALSVLARQYQKSSDRNLNLKTDTI
jgi:hypothetical protein